MYSPANIDVLVFMAYKNLYVFIGSIGVSFINVQWDLYLDSDISCNFHSKQIHQHPYFKLQCTGKFEPLINKYTCLCLFQSFSSDDNDILSISLNYLALTSLHLTIVLIIAIVAYQIGREERGAKTRALRLS